MRRQTESTVVVVVVVVVVLGLVDLVGKHREVHHCTLPWHNADHTHLWILLLNLSKSKWYRVTDDS